MFEERPFTLNADKERKLVQKIGINDAGYVIEYVKDGKRESCPYYKTWVGMLKRVYSVEQHKRQPTYADCTVEESWKTFSNFRKWMEQQDWQGKALDKDLLVGGNKHYGPNTCLFVSRQINSLTVLRENARGDYPLGVIRSDHSGYTYFLARCSFYGKQKLIGSYKTPEEASIAYLKAKRAHIIEVANKQGDLVLKDALMRFQASL